MSLPHAFAFRLANTFDTKEMQLLYFDQSD